MSSQYPEGTYDSSIGRPPIPVDESRRIKEIRWGDIVVEGDGGDPTDDYVPRHLQMPFVWDPRINGWGSLHTFIYHWGMDRAGVPSAPQREFHRPGQQNWANTYKDVIVPGDGYVIGFQSGYNTGATGDSMHMQLFRATFAAGVSFVVWDRAYPSGPGKTPQAHKFYRPPTPIMYSRRDAWHFGLYLADPFDFPCAYPFLDVYWHFRLIDPTIDRNATQPVLS